MERVIIKIPNLLLIVLCSLQFSLYSQEKEKNFNNLNLSENHKETEENTYISPKKIHGLTPDDLRSMLMYPDQEKRISTNQDLWFGNYRIGFYLRPRAELRTNPDFNKKTQDDLNIFPQNSQIWLFADPSPYIEFKITLQNAMLWGDSPPAFNGDNRRFAVAQAGLIIDPKDPNQKVVRNATDLREAYLILKSPNHPLSIQVGRQIPAYGDFRMFGPANFPVNGLFLDGVRIKYDSTLVSVHGLGFVLTEESDAPIGILTANGRRRGSIDDAYLYGLYSTLRSQAAILDVYWITIDKDYIPGARPELPRIRQKDILHTVGFRLTNRTQNRDIPPGQFWDWTLESAWQGGTTGERIPVPEWGEWEGVPLKTERVLYDTFFHVAQTGFHLNPRIRLGFQHVYASGDPNRKDARSATFETLLMPRHSVFFYWNSINGIGELSSWRNVKTYSVNFSWKTEKYGHFVLAWYDILKAKRQDGWYNPPGSLVAGGSSESISNDPMEVGFLGKRLGNAYDFSYFYDLGGYYTIWSGYSLLMAGDSIRNVRDNPFYPDPENRYTFDGRSIFFFVMIVAGF